MGYYDKNGNANLTDKIEIEEWEKFWLSQHPNLQCHPDGIKVLRFTSMINAGLAAERRAETFEHPDGEE